MVDSENLTRAIIHAKYVQLTATAHGTELADGPGISVALGPGPDLDHDTDEARPVAVNASDTQLLLPNRRG